MSVRLVKPVVVTLDHWRSPIWGDRWTIVHEGRSGVTRGTEFEARLFCREMRWTIEEGAWTDPAPEARSVGGRDGEDER